MSTARLRMVVAVAVVALLGLVLVLRASGNDEDDERLAAASAEVPDAAALTRELGPRLEQLLSYTPRTAGSDLPVESGYLTGEFKSAFSTLVTRKIAPTATRFKITTTAEVVDTGVVEAGPDQVRVLVFVNVTTDSTQIPEPRLSGSRLLVTLDEVDGDWLISEFDPV